MAKKKKPDKTYPILELRGQSIVGHPVWGAHGRPILIGDVCHHEDLGKVRVVSVDRGAVHVTNDNSDKFKVHVQELHIKVEQSDLLADVEPWEALRA